MDAMKKLDAHLAGRVIELVKMKKSGVKIVGYFPGGYVPEEMIQAAGAVPLGLCRGGDPEPTTESLSMMPRFLCTFCRSQIGYWKLNEEPVYRLPNLYISPVVDINQKGICDAFSYYAKMEGYRMGIPHDKRPDAIAYFTTRLVGMKQKLEGATGNKIIEEKLLAEIKLGNKRRDFFRAISGLRKDANPVISSTDYVKLHHAALYADRDVFLEILQSMYDELKVNCIKSTNLRRPRIMLVASTLAHGDIRVHDILSETGGEIVYEEVAEGMHPYENNVNPNGDLLGALTDTYFTKRIEGPWDRPYGPRYERLLAKAKEFSVDGVLWYETMYRDGPDIQAFAFGNMFKRDGLAFVKIETEYSVAEKGPMRTRIETFVDLMSKGLAEAII